MIRHCLLALLALPLAGCGQKGPLYMPDSPQGEVVTRPAGTTTDGATSGPSNSPAAPDSPGRAASPAPEVTGPAGAPPDDDKNDETAKKNGAVPPPK
jgi:predicted small lipoprotein YifL